MNKVFSRAYAMAGASAIAVLIAMVATPSGAASSLIDSPLKDGNSEELVALALESGDSIDMPDVQVVGIEIVDGMPLTAVDDYGNETPVVVRGDELVAVGDTYALTKEGQEALVEAGASMPSLEAPETALVGDGGIIQPMGTCGNWTNWAAIAGGAWYTTSKGCGVIGATNLAKVTYEWQIANGGGCTKAKGFLPFFNGTGTTYSPYWEEAGCAQSWDSKYVQVRWGMVLSTPAMQNRSSSYTAGASGSWK